MTELHKSLIGPQSLDGVVTALFDSRSSSSPPLLFSQVRHKISLEDHLHLIMPDLLHSSLEQRAQNMATLGLYSCS